MVQLEGSYPIQIGGEITGSLTVERDGLMTVFSADCRDDGELIRLSVFDAVGNAGYLGVMLPENGRLSLKKRFSRAGLAAFPKEIVCAGVAWEAKKEEHTESVSEAAETVNDSSEETSGLEAERESEMEAVYSPVSEAEADLIWKVQPNPWSLFSEPGIKAALSSVRGALTTMENGAVLLAIPTSMDGIGLSERILEAGEVRMIDGTEYVVFRL